LYFFEEEDGGGDDIERDFIYRAFVAEPVNRAGTSDRYGICQERTSLVV